MPTPQPNPLFGKYEAVCSFADRRANKCKGRIIFEESHSARYVIGSPVPRGTNPSYGKCPLCKRYMMLVTKVPELQAPPGPVGFSSIPTK